MFFRGANVEITGAKILIECLKRENVEVLFGYPGGVLLPVFDALYDSDIRFILTRHEQGAAHMADGYARSSGKVGVCIATSGPGATNLVTGIATAYMDSVPIVAITGQVATHLIGNDAFQEADITGITRPITKHNYLVEDVKDLPRIVKEAFFIASTGRPGPVLIDLPVDIARAKSKFVYPEKVELRGYKPTYKGHPKQIKKAAEIINGAKRPFLYIGGGVIISEAAKLILQLAEKSDIPVGYTLMCKGGFPDEHQLCVGMLGMHGTKAANLSISNADVIIAAGVRFDDRVTGKTDEFALNATIIHLDIDPSSVSKIIEVHIPIVGDVKQILEELLPLIAKKSRKEWLRDVLEWKEKFPIVYDRDDTLGIPPQFVIETIHKLTDGEALITTEVGQNQMWAAQFYKAKKPRSFFSSGGLGTMGYGFPAAIGVKVARPDEIVFDIAGDGSIQMNIQELMTAVSEKVNVIVAILDNQYLGMVRQWQQLFYNKRYCGVDLSKAPDFVKLAEAYGAVGLRATKNKEVEEVIKKALTIKDKPVFIDFKVRREENVLPMVPAGMPISKMIDRSDLA
ncbi:MAG: biosynthetic-type acetolactate synthase large subunit [Candidatus Hydrogenedentota bacterium]